LCGFCCRLYQWLDLKTVTHCRLCTLMAGDLLLVWVAWLLYFHLDMGSLFFSPGCFRTYIKVLLLKVYLHGFIRMIISRLLFGIQVVDRWVQICKFSVLDRFSYQGFAQVSLIYHCPKHRILNILLLQLHCMIDEFSSNYWIYLEIKSPFFFYLKR
jgi:hypothetical protein